jgi:hypothetical protein
MMDRGNKKMKTDKLFNVLVIGGNLLASSAMIAMDAMPEESPKPEIAKRIEFCSTANENMCVKNEQGEWGPQDGVVCCWGTSCNE